MKRESVQHLYLEDGSINPLLMKKEIVICGCGKDGKKLYHELEQQGVNATYFCDSNEELVGKTLFEKRILGYEELQLYETCNVALAFHMWPQVLGKIEERFQDRVFADFPFEHISDADTCILCGSKGLTYSKAHFSPFIQERMFQNRRVHTKLLHCKNCGMYFSEYRPNDEEMDRLYRGYRDEIYQKQRQKYEPEYTKGFYIDELAIAKRKEEIEEFIQPYIGCFCKTGNVLDYGGDEGQCIPENFSSFKKFVYEISGSQVIDGVTLLNDLNDVSKISWDFIMCCQLLEHIGNPLEILKNLANWLKPDGMMYIELPIEERITQYSDLEISEHMNFFQEFTMEKIGDVLDLKTVQIEVNWRHIQALYTHKERSDNFVDL